MGWLGEIGKQRPIPSERPHAEALLEQGPLEAPAVARTDHHLGLPISVDIADGRGACPVALVVAPVGEGNRPARQRALAWRDRDQEIVGLCSRAIEEAFVPQVRPHEDLRDAVAGHVSRNHGILRVPTAPAVERWQVDLEANPLAISPERIDLTYIPVIGHDDIEHAVAIEIREHRRACETANTSGRERLAPDASREAPLHPALSIEDIEAQLPRPAGPAKAAFPGDDDVWASIAVHITNGQRVPVLTERLLGIHRKARELAAVYTDRVDRGGIASHATAAKDQLGRPVVVQVRERAPEIKTTLKDARPARHRRAIVVEDEDAVGAIDDNLEISVAVEVRDART